MLILNLQLSPLTLKLLPDIYCRLQRRVLRIQNPLNIFIEDFISVGQAVRDLLINSKLLVLDFLTVRRPLLQCRQVDRLIELLPHLLKLHILSSDHALAKEILQGRSFELALRLETPRARVVDCPIQLLIYLFLAFFLAGVLIDNSKHLAVEIRLPIVDHALLLALLLFLFGFAHAGLLLAERLAEFGSSCSTVSVDVIPGFVSII